MNTRFNQRLAEGMPLERLLPVNLNMYDDVIKAVKIYVQDFHYVMMIGILHQATLTADLFIL